MVLGSDKNPFPAPAPAPAPAAPNPWYTAYPHTTAPADTSSTGKPKPKPLTTAQQSAKQILIDMLNSFGLSSLAGQLWQEYLTGKPMEVIMADMRKTPQYAARFPGMAQLVKSGHAITEADYISKESADMSLLHAYGMDNMAGNRQFLGSLIGNQVSVTELQSRLDTYKQVVQTLPHEVRDYLQSQYGVHSGDLMNFWLNPNQGLTDIQQKAQAAEVGGAAALAGFGNIDPRMATRLAGMGVDFNQAMNGFQQADQLKGLTESLPGDVASSVSSGDLVNAILGNDGDAALKVQREQARRRAGFSDSESVATTSQGAVGLAPTGV